MSRLLSEVEPALETAVRTETGADVSSERSEADKAMRATPSGVTPNDRQSTPLSWTRATRQRKKRLGVALFALVVLLSLGGLLAYRVSNGAAPAAALVTKPAPAPAKEEAVVLPPPNAAPPTADIVEPQQEPAPTEPVEAPTPTTPASALPNQQPVEQPKAVAPQEAMKPVAAAPKPAVVEPRAPQRQPDVRPEPARPARSPAGSAVPVSDFGGRR